MRTATLAMCLAIKCLVVTPVLAQTPSKAKPAAPIETTVQMRENASKELKAADDLLDKVYSQLLSQIQDPVQQAKLKTAQVAWIKYRNAQAHFEAAFYTGGSIEQQIFLTSLANITKKRTQELQSVLDTEFGH